MKTGTVIAGVSIFILMVVFVTLIIVREDPYFSKKRHVNLQRTEELTGIGCDNAENMTPLECEQFMSIWKTIHQERLDITDSQFTHRVVPIKIWKIDARYNLFRVDYQVQYGDITIAAHDQFPLSISPDIQPPFPTVIVPRDNSPLTPAHVTTIGKARAWNSTITFFTLGDLELPGYEDIEAFASDHLISGEVNYIAASLTFTQEGAPSARLTGTNKDGSRCYSGYINLTNSEYALQYSGPCRVY